jgi:hypothetical protein
MTCSNPPALEDPSVATGPRCRRVALAVHSSGQMFIRQTWDQGRYLRRTLVAHSNSGPSSGLRLLWSAVTGALDWDGGGDISCGERRLSAILFGPLPDHTSVVSARHSGFWPISLKEMACRIGRMTVFLWNGLLERQSMALVPFSGCFIVVGLRLFTWRRQQGRLPFTFLSPPPLRSPFSAALTPSPPNHFPSRQHHISKRYQQRSPP